MFGFKIIAGLAIVAVFIHFFIKIRHASDYDRDMPGINGGDDD